MACVRNHQVWLIGLGLLTIVLGVLAAVASFQADLKFEMCLGFLFIAAGLTHAAHSFWSRPWGGFHFQLFGATHYLLVGLMLLANRGPGAVMVILLLAVLLIMQGMVQFGLVSQLHPDIGRSWMLISGVLAVFLGVLIWAQWPSSAYWMVGLFVGIHLVFRGVSIVDLGLAIRRFEYDDLCRLYSTAARNGESVNSLLYRKRIETPEDASMPT